MSDEKPVDIGLRLAGNIWEVDTLIEDDRVTEAATRDLREAKQALVQARRRIEEQEIPDEVLDSEELHPTVGLPGLWAAAEDGDRVTIYPEDVDAEKLKTNWVTSDLAIGLGDMQ